MIKQQSNGFQLRFPASSIHSLASRYSSELSDRDRRLTKIITEDIFPCYERQGYLTKEQFVRVCEWKTPRTKSRCAANDADFVREVSALARNTPSEQLRIESWTLLYGVNWPTASVFLHFAFPDRYPILDFRALWSLGAEPPNRYSFPFWSKYAEACRSFAKEGKVTMRKLDQALWKYSQDNQKK